ncbi:MAG: 4-hydroxythreonine-4-phosphate dehydrogenase, partial [Ardenticatenaceae bacterium]
MTNFILMLTRNDRTVADARDVYEQVRGGAPTYVGFKDIGLPISELKALTERIHADGRKALLEVVSTGKDEELKSVRAALEMNVDYVLGGRHVTDAVALLERSGIRYFPFCGEPVGHPTRLSGSIESIVADARHLAAIPGV